MSSSLFIHLKNFAADAPRGEEIRDGEDVGLLHIGYRVRRERGVGGATQVHARVYVNIRLKRRDREIGPTDAGVTDGELLSRAYVRHVYVCVLYDSVASPPCTMHRGGSTCAPQSCGLVAPCSKVSKLPRARRAPRTAPESSRFNRVTKIYLAAGRSLLSRS